MDVVAVESYWNETFKIKKIVSGSTITGVTKRQGSLVQKSTRGFLGRILDFVGILIIGWAITNLPRIISAFQKKI